MEINSLKIPAWTIVTLIGLAFLLFAFLLISGKEISWSPLAVVDPDRELELARLEGENARIRAKIQEAQQSAAARPVHVEKFRIDWDNRARCDIDVTGALCKFPWRVPFAPIAFAHLGRTIGCGSGHAQTIKTLHVVSDVEVQVYLARPGGRLDIEPGRFCWEFEVIAVGS